MSTTDDPGEHRDPATAPRRQPVGPGDVSADDETFTRSEHFMREMYGSRYHTDGSYISLVHSETLAETLPERLHHYVSRHMSKNIHGGIWLGSEKNVLDLGHPYLSVARADELAQSLPPGAEFKTIAGLYNPNEHAMLVSGRRGGYYDVVLHEFGHALDHALEYPSEGKLFTEVHARVVPLIQQASPKAAEHFALAGPAGRSELFAEGTAWFYYDSRPEGSGSGGWGDREPPDFLKSAAAGRYLADYYQAFEKALGIIP
ncbi:hypothetical protein [Nocardia sp. NPDC004750]